MPTDRKTGKQIQINNKRCLLYDRCIQYINPQVEAPRSQVRLTSSTSTKYYISLLHALLLTPIFQHSVWSTITALELNPDKVQHDHRRR